MSSRVTSTDRPALGGDRLRGGCGLLIALAFLLPALGPSAALASEPLAVAKDTVEEAMLPAMRESTRRPAPLHPVPSPAIRQGGRPLASASSSPRGQRPARYLLTLLCRWLH